MKWRDDRRESSTAHLPGKKIKDSVLISRTDLRPE